MSVTFQQDFGRGPEHLDGDSVEDMARSARAAMRKYGAALEELDREGRMELERALVTHFRRVYEIFVKSQERQLLTFERPEAGWPDAGSMSGHPTFFDGVREEV